MGSRTEGSAPDDKVWRVTATIKDKDLEREVRYRAIDDGMKIEDLVVEALRHYLATAPPRVHHKQRSQ